MQMKKWKDTRPDWLLKAALRGSVSIMNRPSVPLFVVRFESIRSAIALGAQHSSCFLIEVLMSW